MPHRSAVSHRRVLVAGGGIAAGEALMALAGPAGGRADGGELARRRGGWPPAGGALGARGALGEGRRGVERLAPGDEFVLRPQLLGRPWGSPPLHIGLARLCDEYGATLRRGTLAAVDVTARRATSSAGEHL